MYSYVFFVNDNGFYLGIFFIMIMAITEKITIIKKSRKFC